MEQDPFLAHVARGRFRLGQSDLDSLADSYEGRTTVAAHQDLFGSGPSMFLHVLQAGWACKYKLMPNGRRQIISFHLPGDVLDIDRISQSHLAFSVMALGECRVERIPLAWVKASLDERPPIRDLFMALTALENGLLTEQIVSLGARTARSRLAYLLCSLLERLQARGAALDGSFRSSMTQNDMADALGLSVVHLNRMLQTLKADGLVATRGSHYNIMSVSGLQAVADLATDA